jgi:predicted phosphodiesterase
MRYVRIAILSDIHGNLLALDAVMTDLENHSPDDVWCGGDIAWGGPWPGECIRRVRAMGWTCVRGNTDVWITGDPQTIEDPEEREQLSRLAAAHRLSDDDAEWLLSLPIGYSPAGSILLVHGTPESPFVAPMPDAAASEFSPYVGKAKLIVFGHVHRAFTRCLADGTVVSNPGSVGLPGDGETASYLLVDRTGTDVTLTHRRVAYDRRAALAEARRRDDLVGELFLGFMGE